MEYAKTTKIRKVLAVVESNGENNGEIDESSSKRRKLQSAGTGMCKVGCVVTDNKIYDAEVEVATCSSHHQQQNQDTEVEVATSSSHPQQQNQDTEVEVATSSSHPQQQNQDNVCMVNNNMVIQGNQGSVTGSQFIQCNFGTVNIINNTTEATQDVLKHEVTISSHILKTNVQLRVLKHNNREGFQCVSRMPDSHLVPLKDSKFAKSMTDTKKKQDACLHITNGLHYMHQKGIKHRNINISDTVVVNSQGHTMIRDSTSMPHTGDWKAKLMYLASDIEDLATVIWYVLTGKDILFNDNKRTHYKIPGYKECKTTPFFKACLDDSEKRPPVYEVWCFLHGLFGLPLLNTDKSNQPNPFRLKKKKRLTLNCKSCPKKTKLIDEELALVHKEPFKHHVVDVHYCTRSTRCILKKFQSFDGQIIYDLYSNPVISIDDIFTLRDRGFRYHDY